MIDLHVHSTASDGMLSPSEVVSLAKEVGITTMALTDHDTIAGVKEAIDAGNKLGINVIPGIELSAEFDDQLHILGYFVDIEDKNFNEFLDDIVQKRIAKNKRYLKCFNDNGIDITYEELTVVAKSDDMILKPHFATLLKNKGIIDNVKEAYTKFFDVEPYKSVLSTKPSAKEVIEAITNAGGIAVMAHPILTKLNDEDLRKLIFELKSYGLKGIEVYHSDHSKEDKEKYIKYAEEFNLLITGGNDFHGEGVKPGLKLGSGYNNENIITDTSIVCDLKDAYDKMHGDKKYTDKRISARGLVIHDNKVLTLKRIKENKFDGKPYYVLPGGGNENNETDRNNILREMKEEIDEIVKPISMFATLEDETSYQHFFQCELSHYDNLHLGTGDGEEFVDASRGSYEIFWIDLDEIDNYNLCPPEIKEKIIDRFVNKNNLDKEYYVINLCE
ncbi:MAG: PHP domain-containing protein [Clostridia bacterium]|nr:PHP domain-containing protein [Clostridia bacterium]